MARICRALAPLRAAQRTGLSRAGAGARTFSLSGRRWGGDHGHESRYDPPGGWLWGIKPGEKPEPEGWEWPMYIFCGSLLATAVALVFKPDTS